MNALKAPGLLLFFCVSLQGQILDHTRGNIATTNINPWLSSSKAMAIADNVLLLQKEIGEEWHNDYAWYTNEPKATITTFLKWKKQNEVGKNAQKK